MVNFSLISQIASENTTITSKLDSIYVHASEAYSSSISVLYRSNWREQSVQLLRQRIVFQRVGVTTLPSID